MLAAVDPVCGFTLRTRHSWSSASVFLQTLVRAQRADFRRTRVFIHLAERR